MSFYPGPIRLDDPRARRIVVLMNKYLVRMQSSALKHVYLTSIVNVITHPQVRERKPGTDLVYTVGFGNQARTLPILLIQEAHPDRSIRHAFVPNLDDPYERSLVDKLQQSEVKWARHNGVQPRNIKRQLQDYSPDEICYSGINRYDPKPQTWNDPDPRNNRLWCRTRYLPEALTIDHHGRPDMSIGSKDYRAIVNNIRESLNAQWLDNDDRLEISSLDVRRTKPYNTLKVTRHHVRPKNSYQELEYNARDFDDVENSDDGLSL